MSASYKLPGLAGRTALVTGGSRGIGAAIVSELAAQGAKVVYTHLKPSAAPAGVRSYVCDVRDPKRLREVLAEIGNVDLLVNNAGITRDRSFKKLSEAEWDEVLEVNLKGVFLTCKEIMPGMVERGFGRIVNVSSVIAATGNFGQANYAAAKAGLQGLTRTLALEGAARGVCVNALCPGFTATDMYGLIPDEAKAKINQKIPLGRVAMPAEIAGAALFLLSDLSSYITGQSLHVNGGMYWN